MLTALLSACAQITAPTGGDRDIQAPVVIRETPVNGSVNFDDQSIEIEFDEFIQLTGAQDIVISPSPTPPPEISAKKKTLSIRWKSDLDSATTYSIFFGGSVGDINENNKLDNYSYVFSTGSFLDSLTLGASVQAEAGKVPEGTYLLLYRDLSDSAFLSKRPVYLSRVGTDGQATLRNLRAGTYQAYVLCDKNLNYYYDLPTELIGFMDNPVILPDSTGRIQLSLFQPDPSQLRVMEYSRTIDGGTASITLNRGLSFTKDEIRASLREDTSVQVIAFQEKDNLKLKLYFTGLPADSGNYTLLLHGNGFPIDSLPIRCVSRKQPAIRFFTDTVALKKLSVLETQPLILESSAYSLSDPDTSRIRLLDSLGQPQPFRISRDGDLRTYRVEASWTDRMAYRLVFSDSALFDLAGNPLQAQTLFFSGVSRKKAGSLILRLELPGTSRNTLIRLLDASGALIRQTATHDSLLVWDAGLLAAGSYTVESIDDVNDNGIRNSGSFETRTPPERLYKYDKPILIKENWDAEETIRVDYGARSISLPERELTAPVSKPGQSPGLPGQRLKAE